MTRFSRRRVLMAVSVTALLLAAPAVFLLARGHDLKSRLALVSVGMTRAQVEDILGPPVLTLPRTGGRGTGLIWTDQLWQVDVYTGRDDRVELTGCKPSDSAYRRTVGRLFSRPK